MCFGLEFAAMYPKGTFEEVHLLIAVAVGCVVRRQTVSSVLKHYDGVLIYSHVVSVSWRRVVR